MTMRHSPAPRSTPAARGAGALVVVMVLFFIMSLVAAYASRGLIFEQKTSANNYRATAAFEAAEAGLDWAVAMLNGGRIDATCSASTDVGNNTFRDRYLVADVNGNVGVRKWLDTGFERPLVVSCVRGATGWTCSCPAASAPALAAPTGSTPAPAFRVVFETVVGQPGVVRVYARGCSNFGTQCVAGATTTADATAEVNALLGLTASLVRTPVAALTVRGGLDADGPVRLVNADPATRGITLDAGGEVHAPNVVLASTPGSPSGDSVVQHDAALSGIADAGGLSAGDRLFLATFGMAPRVYRGQPAVVRVACVDECSDELLAAAQQFPGRVLWVSGDLNVDAPLAIGSITAPVMLVVDGDIHLGDAADVTIDGLVYSRGANWANGGGQALVRGAFVVEGAADGSFGITGAPTIVFDADIVDRLKQVQARHVLDFGSFARVPGSWRDFQ